MDQKIAGFRPKFRSRLREEPYLLYSGDQHATVIRGWIGVQELEASFEKFFVAILFG